MWRSIHVPVYTIDLYLIRIAVCRKIISYFLIRKVPAIWQLFCSRVLSHTIKVFCTVLYSGLAFA